MAQVGWQSKAFQRFASSVAKRVMFWSLSLGPTRVKKLFTAVLKRGVCQACLASPNPFRIAILPFFGDK